MDDYSLNEAASRVRLAAKGTGYPWGLADEVYRSVFWLIQHDLPALVVLQQLLTSYESPHNVEQSMPIFQGSAYQSRGAWLCPVMLGCSLTDGMDSTQLNADITFTDLKYPLLLLPFAAELALKFDRVVVVSLESTQLLTDGEHLRFSSVQVPLIEHVKSGSIQCVERAEVNFEISEKLQLHNRVKIDSTLWQSLDKLAHRTYAPATEISRNSGAGAGVLDND